MRQGSTPMHDRGGRDARPADQTRPRPRWREDTPSEQRRGRWWPALSAVAAVGKVAASRQDKGTVMADDGEVLAPAQVQTSASAGCAGRSSAHAAGRVHNSCRRAAFRPAS